MLAAGAQAAPREVAFTTFDGVEVVGDLYEADAPKGAPIIVLCHQGGSNARGEYGDYIAPRLVEAGYHVLAIDQRLGGETYGSHNRTQEGIERAKRESDRPARPNEAVSYCTALPDIDGAVTFVRTQGFTGKLALWGSSYSGALVFQVAASRPDEISALFVFSPAMGSPMRECEIEPTLEQVKASVFVARPAIEMRRPAIQQQTITLVNHGAYMAVAPKGVHGASMLHPERGEDVEPTWDRLLAFLDYALRGGPMPEPQPQSHHGPYIPKRGPREGQPQER